MADADLLAVKGLIAGYGGRPVINGVDLTLRPGEVLGLLGANGSGKSTLLKAISGQLPASAGQVAIAGIDIAGAPERAKAQFGLAVDIGDLPRALTGQQYLELVASIRGCAADAWPGEDPVAALGLTRWIDRPIAACSLGTRMKLSIAAALLGGPPLLIFDEALNGLDPVAAFTAKRMIASLARSNSGVAPLGQEKASHRHGIILATHVVETVPTVCTRAVLLSEGRIVREWDAAQLAAGAAAPGGFEAIVMAALGQPLAA